MCWGKVKGEDRAVQRWSAEHPLTLKEAWEHDLWGEGGESWISSALEEQAKGGCCCCPQLLVGRSRRDEAGLCGDTW